MYENLASRNLLPIQPNNEVHVSDALGQLVSFTLAVGAEELQPAEGNAGWASYENQRLLLIDVFFGLPSYAPGC